MKDKDDLAVRLAALIADQERLLEDIRDKETGFVRPDGSILATLRERWAAKRRADRNS